MTTYYLIARTKQIEGDYEACVSYSAEIGEIRNQKFTEEYCWLDEGVEYEIVESYSTEQANCEYNLLLDRVSK